MVKNEISNFLVDLKITKTFILVKNVLANRHESSSNMCGSSEFCCAAMLCVVLLSVFFCYVSC